MLARRAVGRALLARERGVATLQVRRLLRGGGGRVRVSWDLDNTLADSGSLLHAGRTLEEAVGIAEPMRNMPAFFTAVRDALPHADHLILSARRAAMRKATCGWLERHGLAGASAVCLVPSAAAKPAIWERLAAAGPLVIVDDLCHAHETGTPVVYDDLVEAARAFATAFVGHEEIAQIVADEAAIGPVVARISAALGD